MTVVTAVTAGDGISHMTTLQQHFPTYSYREWCHLLSLCCHQQKFFNQISKRNDSTFGCQSGD
jgi:hypothetical protein